MGRAGSGAGGGRWAGGEADGWRPLGGWRGPPGPVQRGACVGTCACRPGLWRGHGQAGRQQATATAGRQQGVGLAAARRGRDGAMQRCGRVATRCTTPTGQLGTAGRAAGGAGATASLKRAGLPWLPVAAGAPQRACRLLLAQQRARCGGLQRHAPPSWPGWRLSSPPEPAQAVIASWWCPVVLGSGFE